MRLLYGAVINECIKKRQRIRGILILLAILALAFVILSLMPDNGQEGTSQASSSWKTVLNNQIEQLEQSRGVSALDDEAYKQLSYRLQLQQYQYEHNINPEPEGAIHFITSDMQGMFIKSFLPLVMLFLGADIFSREVSNKSIKRLLLSPLGRFRILLSKWLALILMSAGCLTLYFLMVFCAGLYFESFNLGSGRYAVTADATRFHSLSAVTYVMIGYLFNLITITSVSAIVVLFSYLFRKGVGFSVCFSMVMILVLDAFLKKFRDNISIIKYYPTYHLDLLSSFSGNGYQSVFGASGSLSVLIVTTVLCIGCVYLPFRKQDM